MQLIIGQLIGMIEFNGCNKRYITDDQNILYILYYKYKFYYYFCLCLIIIKLLIKLVLTYKNDRQSLNIKDALSKEYVYEEC